jgi:CheY-like chemotaxis protein
MDDKSAISKEQLQQQALGLQQTLHSLLWQVNDLLEQLRRTSASAEPRAPHFLAPVTSKTVLIIEDNELEREGLAAVLRQSGYEAVGAASVDSALACEAPPCLILLDMMLGDKDGWRFLQMRKTKPALAHVPVVITTGLGVASKEWAESLGAVGILRKPFDPEELLREVNCRCL